MTPVLFTLGRSEADAAADARRAQAKVDVERLRERFCERLKPQDMLDVPGSGAGTAGPQARFFLFVFCLGFIKRKNVI